MLKNIHSKSFLIGMIFVMVVLGGFIFKFLALPGISIPFSQEVELSGYFTHDIKCSSYKNGHLTIAGAKIKYNYNKCERLKANNNEIYLIINKSNYIKRISYLSVNNEVVIDKKYSTLRDRMYMFSSIMFLCMSIFFFVFIILYLIRLFVLMLTLAPNRYK